ncbi:LIMR family protein [Colletotrichum siamense]|nr:LIMR family protein [Colletotrichum siamense]KAF4875438.1 LIMR family protein [Colletotrichum siamense]
MLHIVSASSPVPSEIFALLALLSISVIVLFILRHYLPLRTTPAFYLVPIFFALWLPACMVLLVPIDLASSARTDDEATRGVWLPQRMLLVSWRITYWLTFALTWFILPILGEYSDSGYREPQDSLKYSLRQNAQYHVMVLGTAGVGLAYLFIRYQPSITTLKTSFMALAYFYGLVFAIYLMGHGLVSIPRRLFRYSSISGRLRRLQIRAPKLYEKMEDSLLNLEDVELQVSELGRRKTGSAVKFSEWIDELVESANLPESHPRSTMGVAVESRSLPTVITEKFMADLSRKLMRARHARSRYVNEWNDLLKEAAETQAILDSAASKKLEFGAPSPHAGFWDRFTVHTPYTRYLYYSHCEPYGAIFLGAFLAVASALIVWSEVIKAAFPQLSVIRLTVVHHWVGEKGQVGFAGQVISVLWLLYMCAATFTTMTEVKTWRGRALVRRNTAYESAFWYAGQVAKLSVPLSYNFMTFLSESIYSKTRFYGFLGQLIDFTPMGRWADYLFPIFVLVPVAATLFGLYGKIKRMFGFGGDFMDDDEGDGRVFGTGSWREGRDLIERELGGNSALRRREEAFARLEVGGRSAPVLTIPGARTGAAASPARSPVRATHDRQPGQASRTRPYRDEVPEDENFFESLGHRMKNTIDTFEAPQWFQDIKKPKWMGGDDDEPGSSSNGGGVESDIRRWFGGEGRVRL